MKTHKKITLSLLLLILFSMSLFMQLQLLLNWDVSWLLLATKRWLAGGTYTSDFFDPDPPMIFYVYSLPVLFSKIAFSMVTNLRIYIFLISFASLYLSYGFLERIFKKDYDLKIIFLLALAFLFWIMPTYEFGQREHIILMLMTPFLLSVIARMQDTRTASTAVAVVLGIALAIAIGIKPYYLGIFLLSECYLLLYTFSFKNLWRLEVWVTGLTLLLYLLSVKLFFPDYIAVVVPYALRLYPGAMAVPFANILRSPAVLFCILVATFGILTPSRLRYKNVIIFLSVMTLGFVGIYVYQRSYFYYHILLALSYALIVAALNFILLIQEKSKLFLFVQAVSAVIFFIFVWQCANVTWTTLSFVPVYFFAYFAVIFAFLLFYLQKDRIVKDILILFSIVILSFLFTKFLTSTAWLNHRFSLTVIFLIVLFGIFSAENVKSKAINALHAFLAIILFSFPTYYIYANFSQIFSIEKHMRQHDMPLFEKYKTQGPLSVFSTEISNTFPALAYAGAEYGSRIPFFWMLPSLVQNAGGVQSQLDMDFMINLVAADLNNRKPAYVFVDTRPKKPYFKNAFDYLPYFSKNKNFRAAWSHYAYFTKYEVPSDIFTDRNILQFTIYRRIDA